MRVSIPAVTVIPVDRIVFQEHFMFLCYRLDEGMALFLHRASGLGSRGRLRISWIVCVALGSMAELPVHTHAQTVLLPGPSLPGPASLLPLAHCREL